MQMRKIININNNLVTLIDEKLGNFLCSLLWPIIDAYWVSAVYLFTLKRDVNRIVEYKLLP